MTISCTEVSFEAEVHTFVDRGNSLVSCFPGFLFFQEISYDVRTGTKRTRVSNATPCEVCPNPNMSPGRWMGAEGGQGSPGIRTVACSPSTL